MANTKKYLGDSIPKEDEMRKRALTKLSCYLENYIRDLSDKSDVKKYEKVGLLIIIYSQLKHLALPVEKWEELFSMDNPFEILYKGCLSPLNATVFEVEDILLSCRTIGELDNNI